MFAKRKESAKITEKDPVFEGRYLGSVETFSSSGKGCALVPVKKLWENSVSEKHLKKVFVVISTTGLTLKESKKDEGRKFIIENITFCNADKTATERIFCWIWKVPGVKRLECHAVLCRSRETAHAMALVLSRAFQVAYKDWRTNRGKQIRQEKTSQMQEIHRRLSNGGEVADSEGNTRQDVCQRQDVSSAHGGKYLSNRGQTDNEENGRSDQLAPRDCINNVITEKRRASTTSTTSGFASSVILDPDDEEWMQGNAHVQAIVRGEIQESGHDSE